MTTAETRNLPTPHPPLIILRVTNLIFDALSFGGLLLLWSALRCGVLMRLHILFITLLAKRITCAQLHYFYKMQNAMLILSHKTQERITNCSCEESFSFDFSFSRSLTLLSRSLQLFHLCLYLALSVTQALPLPLSLSRSLYMSTTSSRFLSFSHTITQSLDPPHFISLSLSLSLYLTHSRT